MDITITINTDNDAFHGNGMPGMSHAYEVARILRDLAYVIQLEDTVEEKSLRDINGNKCGSIEIKEANNGIQ